MTFVAVELTEQQRELRALAEDFGHHGDRPHRR